MCKFTGMSLNETVILCPHCLPQGDPALPNLAHCKDLSSVLVIASQMIGMTEIDNNDNNSDCPSLHYTTALFSPFHKEAGGSL